MLVFQTINLVAGLLPNRIKKLVVLSSLAGKVKCIDQHDCDILEKINKALSLSADSSALKLPVYLKSRIWNKLDYERIRMAGITCTVEGEIELSQLATGQRKKLVNAVIDAMPSRLKYSSKTLMRKDMMKLLYELSGKHEGRGPVTVAA